MRMITRMLLASVLAIGAGSFADCGDTDCPATVSAGTSCSSAGLSCFTAAGNCTCNQGAWSCSQNDLPAVVPPDLSTRDLSMPDDGSTHD